MPNNMIKKDSREGKGTVKSLEKKWDKAKDAAGQSKTNDKWALVNHIYQNSLKSNFISDTDIIPGVKNGCIARILLSAALKKTEAA